MHNTFIKLEGPYIQFDGYDNKEQRNATRTQGVVEEQQKGSAKPTDSRTKSDENAIVSNGKAAESLSLPNCKTCKLNFSSSNLYNVHMKEQHNLDPTSLDTYCQLCDFEYLGRGNFRRYLRRIHKMKFLLLKPRPNHDIEPDPKDPNNYCKSCTFKHPTPAAYRRHLHLRHKVIVPCPVKLDPNIHPNPNDPNFYCNSCKFKYLNIITYRVHLYQKHKIGTRRRRKQIIPDPNDPTFYCKPCKHTYCSKSSYIMHLRWVREIKITLK